MPFLIDESNAIKQKLQGLTVSVQGGKTVSVPVWFREPEPELRRLTYPSIIIDLLAIQKANERESRGHWRASSLQYSNLLSPNQSSIETDVTGWRSVANCSLFKNSDSSYDGSFSLGMRSSAQGDAEAEITPYIPVIPGNLYSGWLFTQAGLSGPRNCYVKLNWYNSGGNLISSTQSEMFTNDQVVWTRGLVGGVAPTNATQVSISLLIKNSAPQEIHFIDYANVTVSSPTISVKEIPIPYWIYFQVATYSRYWNHDFSIQQQLETTFDRLPLRFGYLEINGITRDLQVVSVDKADDSDPVDQKRRFRKFYTVRVSAEVDLIAAQNVAVVLNRVPSIDFQTILFILQQNQKIGTP